MVGAVSTIIKRAALLRNLACYALGLAAGLALAGSSVTAATVKVEASSPAGSFVKRSGTQLTLDGKPFRFGGANVDWLGLNSNSYYRPDVFYPTPQEVDDALDTVVEMGGTVVRSHSLGINVGCPQCVEPDKGVFNEAALRRLDYAIKRIGDHHLKVIIPLVDVMGQNCDQRKDGTFPQSFYYGNTCSYLLWNGDHNRNDFNTNEAVIREFDNYVSHLLNRVNTYTGVAYKNDPAILGWETCNTCVIQGPKEAVVSWVLRLAAFIKSIDKNHLVIDDSGLLRMTPPGTYMPSKDVDALCSQYYPYWDRKMGAQLKIDSSPASLVKDAKASADHNLPYIACEFGWDQANWATKEQLETFLNAAQNDPHIAGALFWNLEAHASDHGWMPVHGPAAPGLKSADEDLVPGGDWWAFYYTGRNTRWNNGDDMAARGQSLRSFAYAMSGRPVPPLGVPNAPVITSIDSGLVRWRGSVGAKDYSVELARSPDGPWTVGCDRCANDESGQWQDPSLQTGPVWYRIVPFNADGAAGSSSQAVAGKAG